MHLRRPDRSAGGAEWRDLASIPAVLADEARSLDYAALSAASLGTTNTVPYAIASRFA
jgi:hypothetical protein